MKMKMSKSTYAKRIVLLCQGIVIGLLINEHRWVFVGLAITFELFYIFKAMDINE